MNWIQKKVLGAVVGWVHTQLKKRNWVTKTGAVSLILSGLGMIFSGLHGEMPDLDLIVEGFAVVSGGIATLGARRAIADLKNGGSK